MKLPGRSKAVLRWLPAHLLRDVPPVDQATSEFASKPIGHNPMFVGFNWIVIRFQLLFLFF